PLDAAALAYERCLVGREVRRRAVELCLLRALALGRQVGLERVEPVEREQRALALVRREEVGLVREPAQRRPLDLPPREHGAQREREPDRDDDGEERRREQARPQRVEPGHGWTALYPAPRTVRIRSGRPSFRRSCATWTSTVRVPP